jgi:hypothetical protein
LPVAPSGVTAKVFPLLVGNHRLGDEFVTRIVDGTPHSQVRSGMLFLRGDLWFVRVLSSSPCCVVFWTALAAGHGQASSGAQRLSEPDSTSGRLLPNERLSGVAAEDITGPDMVLVGVTSVTACVSCADLRSRATRQSRPARTVDLAWGFGVE